MGLSSNSIIHFTSEKENLKSILKSNFRPFYCREEIIIDNRPMTYAAPMVSFCDIPLSEIKSHINKYGAYGLGLTKEWAERNRLNPVLYFEKKIHIIFKLCRCLPKIYFKGEKAQRKLEKRRKTNCGYYALH